MTLLTLFSIKVLSASSQSTRELEVFVNNKLFTDRSLKAEDMLLFDVKLVLDKSLNEIQF